MMTEAEERWALSYNGYERISSDRDAAKSYIARQHTSAASRRQARCDRALRPPSQS
jgi:hypothetical protein